MASSSRSAIEPCSITNVPFMKASPSLSSGSSSTPSSARQLMKRAATGGPVPSPNLRTVPRALVRHRFPRLISRAISTRSQSMAPTRNAKAACGRSNSGDSSSGPPEPGRNGRADPALSAAGRRFPGRFQGENMAEAVIMDKSGKTPPNIGHFP